MSKIFQKEKKKISTRFLPSSPPEHVTETRPEIPLESRSYFHRVNIPPPPPLPLVKNSSLRENVEIASCRWIVVYIYIYIHSISIAGRSERFKGVHPPQPPFHTPWNISLIRFIPLSAIRMLKRISAFLLHVLLLFSGFLIEENSNRNTECQSWRKGLPHLPLLQKLFRWKLEKGEALIFPNKIIILKL